MMKRKTRNRNYRK